MTRSGRPGLGTQSRSRGGSLLGLSLGRGLASAIQGGVLDGRTGGARTTSWSAPPSRRLRGLARRLWPAPSSPAPLASAPDADAAAHTALRPARRPRRAASPLRRLGDAGAVRGRDSRAPGGAE